MIRILHIIFSVTGGVGTFIRNVLKTRNPEEVTIDILCEQDIARSDADELRSLGGRVFPVLVRGKPMNFARQFSSVINAFGPYDIVHSHSIGYSGIAMVLAAAKGVPVRITHSHENYLKTPTWDSWRRRLLIFLTTIAARRYSTGRIAVSEESAFMFGPSWRKDGNLIVLPCGIDFVPFENAIGLVFDRSRLELPENALVIGHIGRFVPVKNHKFIVLIFRELLQREPRAYLLLVGDGPLRSGVEAEVAKLGIDKHVIFTGDRNDVPDLLSGVVDVLLLPSHSEGVPLVTGEAQATGTPVVASTNVPPAAEFYQGGILRLDLSEPASVWADALLRAADAPVKTPSEAIALAKKSIFAMPRNMDVLMDFYERQLRRNAKRT